MTGLLFVTARSTDVKDLNRLLLELRDWEVSSSQAQQFLDRFRFVTKHNPRALVTNNSHRRSSASSTSSCESSSQEHQEHAHGTFPPVPPSATFANSWVDRSAEEIEGFMNMLASNVAEDNNNNKENTQEKESAGGGGPSFLERRDSGYSTCSSNSSATAGMTESCYNASMYLMVDEAGLSTGTATLGCRRQTGAGAAGGGWDRVRGVPWTEVCSVWRAVQASRSVECLFGAGTKQLLQIQDANALDGESREVSYQRPAGQEVARRESTPPRDCRRRDMELSMWRECGLV